MSEPIMYTRSNGTQIPIKEMNDHHLLATIKKMKRDGYISSADYALFQTDPGPEGEMASREFELAMKEMERMTPSTLLTALEAERKDRGLHD